MQQSNTNNLDTAPTLQLNAGSDHISSYLDWTADKPLPVFADRRTCAAIVTHRFFPVKPRTIATWPLVARRPNGKVIYEVDEVMAHAAKRFDEAYSYKQA
jgi:hypothetical protein